MSRFEHEVSSGRAAPAERVWAHATSVEGINAELAPLLKMTAPPELRSLSDVSVVLGQPIGKSTALQRVVSREGDGCRLTDHLTFEPRLGGPLVARFLRRVFANRHAYLRRTFGG